MGMEVELKYAAPDAQTLDAVLREMADGRAVRTIQMQTRYFDSLDGTLSARKWTLRLRQENERTVACLKSPRQAHDSLSVRNEWQCEADDLPTAVPQLIATGAPPELASLVACGLREICGARFTRRAVTLHLADGSTTELALDLGELTGGEKTLPLCEVELELLHGGPEETQKLAQDLAVRHGLRAEPRSKFVRASALADLPKKPVTQPEPTETCDTHEELIMQSNYFEQEFETFMEQREYDSAENALFSIARSAFLAGWRAAEQAKQEPSS